MNNSNDLLVKKLNELLDNENRWKCGEIDDHSIITIPMCGNLLRTLCLYADSDKEKLIINFYDRRKQLDLKMEIDQNKEPDLFEKVQNLIFKKIEEKEEEKSKVSLVQLLEDF